MSDIRVDLSTSNSELEKKKKEGKKLKRIVRLYHISRSRRLVRLYTTSLGAEDLSAIHHISRSRRLVSYTPHL